MPLIEFEMWRCGECNYKCYMERQIVKSPDRPSRPILCPIGIVNVKWIMLEKDW